MILLVFLCLVGSIHVILGKPGSGKSLYAVVRLIRELLETERNIVTNLPLRLDRLNEYLQKLYPERNLRILDRVRLLSETELRFFWKFRGDGDVAPPELALLESTHGEMARNQLLKSLDIWARTPSAGDVGRGVCYMLDEAHIAFNARDWANIGKAALFYLSQHRKLGDIVWVITQAPGNLDKQFRSVAEDFTVLRNEYTAKYGIFRGRGRFVRKTYLAEPSANAEPFESAAFTLDKEGIASCYDTAKGIGVHGNKADIGRRAKGIPIWVVIPAGLVLALACVFVPWLLGRSAGKLMTGDAARKIEAVQKDAGLVPLPGSVVPGSAASAASSAVPLPLPAIPRSEGVYLTQEWVLNNRPERPLWVSGVIYRGASFTVYLSDGRVFTDADKTIERLDRRGLVIGGMLVPMKPLESVYPKEATPANTRGEIHSEVKSHDLPVSTNRQNQASAEDGSWRMDSDGVQRLTKPLTW